MRLEIARYGLRVIPESEQDEAYIEEVLKLKKDNDSIRLVRSNAIGLSCMGLLETDYVRSSHESLSKSVPDNKTDTD